MSCLEAFLAAYKLRVQPFMHVLFLLLASAFQNSDSIMYKPLLLQLLHLLFMKATSSLLLIGCVLTDSRNVILYFF